MKACHVPGCTSICRVGAVEGEEASEAMMGQGTKSTEDSAKHLSLSFRWWGGGKKDIKQGNYMNRFIL